jgi:hypothetical protein
LRHSLTRHYSASEEGDARKVIYDDLISMFQNTHITAKSKTAY